MCSAIRRMAHDMPPACLCVSFPPLQPFFTAPHFFKFPRDQHGRISCDSFFRFISYNNKLAQTRIELSRYDTEGKGFLREADLEVFFYDLIAKYTDKGLASDAEVTGAWPPKKHKGANKGKHCWLAEGPERSAWF